MHGDSVEAIGELRSRMAAESAVLRKLENEFQHPYFKKRAQRAINDCEEADIMFLRPLEKESWRDTHQEARAIAYADSIFQLAVVQRKQLEDIMSKYDATAVVAPWP